VPTCPGDLGEPDRVYLQDMNGPVVVLVWIEPGNPDRARLSLHALGPGTYARKFVGEVVREAEVGGRRALWTRGEHLLQFEHAGRVIDGTRRLVQGNTLIWTRGAVTYRLETGLPLREAVKIAESLRQAPGREPPGMRRCTAGRRSPAGGIPNVTPTSDSALRSEWRGAGRYPESA
jgi:hypothetical protein